MQNEQPKSFEEIFEQLETIVGRMEKGDLPLQESLQLFEKGIRLSREGARRLDEAEQTIERLLRDEQGQDEIVAWEE